MVEEKLLMQVFGLLRRVSGGKTFAPCLITRTTGVEGQGFHMYWQQG